MKRKKKFGKMTYSELKEADHEQLASWILERRNKTIMFIQENGRCPNKFKPIKGKGFIEP